MSIAQDVVGSLVNRLEEEQTVDLPAAGVVDSIIQLAITTNASGSYPYISSGLLAKAIKAEAERRGLGTAYRFFSSAHVNRVCVDRLGLPDGYPPPPSA